LSTHSVDISISVCVELCVNLRCLFHRPPTFSTIPLLLFTSVAKKQPKNNYLTDAICTARRNNNPNSYG